MSITVNENKDDIAAALQRIERFLSLQASLFACMTLFGGMIMQTRDDLVREVESLKEKIRQDNENDQKVVDLLDSVNEQLQARNTELEGQADMSDIIASIQEASALVQPATSRTTTSEPAEPGTTDSGTPQQP